MKRRTFLGGLLAALLLVPVAALSTGKAQFFENAVLNVLRATNITAPATVYVALYTVCPTDTTAGTEVTGGDYARKAVTFGAPSGNPASVTNSGAVTWTAVTWSGTVTCWSIMDALTIGNMLYWFDSVDKTVSSGDTVNFAIAAISVTEN